jgi:hypothetical protein
MVRCFMSGSRALWVTASDCCFKVLIGTKRIDGRLTASQIAAASAAPMTPLSLPAKKDGTSSSMTRTGSDQSDIGAGHVSMSRRVGMTRGLCEKRPNRTSPARSPPGARTRAPGEPNVRRRANKSAPLFPGGGRQTAPGSIASFSDSIAGESNRG